MLGVDREQLRLPEVGVWTSIWLTAGSVEAASANRARWWGMTLLTPMAGTCPSARSFSSAR